MYHVFKNSDKLLRRLLPQYMAKILTAAFRGTAVVSHEVWVWFTNALDPQIAWKTSSVNNLFPPSMSIW